MANPIVRTDRMSGTVVPTDSVSLRYTEDVFNGSILGIGGLLDAQMHIYEGLVPQAGMNLAVIASPEVMKASNKGTDFVSEFYNEAGEDMFGQILVNRGNFSVTKNGVTGGESAVVGHKAFIPAGTIKISVGDTASGIEFGKVIAIEDDFIVFEVAFPAA